MTNTDHEEAGQRLAVYGTLRLGGQITTCSRTSAHSGSKGEFVATRRGWVGRCTADGTAFVYVVAAS
jgi:hypothetical protein